MVGRVVFYRPTIGRLVPSRQPYRQKTIARHRSDDSFLQTARVRYFWFRAACAAARRAMGTRKGEQLT